MVKPLAPPEFVVGLDLGQRKDNSAIVVLELAEISNGQRNPVTYDFHRERIIRLRHAERVHIGTPYGDIVEHVGRVIRHPKVQGGTLVADATGVGAPVVELLRKAKLPCRLVAAQITGGSAENSDGEYYRVPKRDLLVGLQILIEHHRFEMAATTGTEALLQEMIAMKAAGGQRGGKRDDMVLALALAWWWLRKRIPWN